MTNANADALYTARNLAKALTMRLAGASDAAYRNGESCAADGDREAAAGFYALATAYEAACEALNKVAGPLA